MRLLHAIASVDPSGGGPIEGVKQIASVTTKRGNVVEIASLDAPGAPYIADCPLTVFPLGPGMGSFRYVPGLVPRLRALAVNRDAVIVNGIWQFNSLAAWLALRKSEVPYFVFTHGMLDPWFKRAYRLKHLKKCVYWPLQYRVLRDATAVLFTSEEERLLARQSFRPYKAKEEVVNYGTAGPAGNTDVELRIFSDEFPQLHGKRALLYLSRIHPKKGCDLLIQAFAKVFGGDPSRCLVMTGPDQTGWQTELQTLAAKLGIADRVVWTGMLQGDLKWGAYHACEAFVLPSHQENFGIVVAEAAACGKPVLISDKVNIWREIEQDGAGIVGTDDLEGTVATLEKWKAMTDDERAAMGARARQCFENRFEIHRAAQSLLDVIGKYTAAK